MNWPFKTVEVHFFVTGPKIVLIIKVTLLKAWLDEETLDVRQAAISLILT